MRPSSFVTKLLLALAAGVIFGALTFAGLETDQLLGFSDQLSDRLQPTGKADDSRIDVDQDHEITYWSRRLGVSRERLREAVAKAGPMVKNVERELRG